MVCAEGTGLRLQMTHTRTSNNCVVVSLGKLMGLEGKLYSLKNGKILEAAHYLYHTGNYFVQDLILPESHGTMLAAESSCASLNFQTMTTGSHLGMGLTAGHWEVRECRRSLGCNGT